MFGFWTGDERWRSNEEIERDRMERLSSYDPGVSAVEGGGRDDVPKM